jgi:hypothetical protein
VRCCAAWPATTPWHCATHSRTAVTSHPRKRTAEPSRRRPTTMPRPHKDDAVMSGQRDRSPLLPSTLCDRPRRPQHHPGHCITIPNAVGACGDGTPPNRLLCPVRPHDNSTLESAHGRPPNGRPLRHHPRSHSWTHTGRAMTPCQKQDSPGQPSTPRRCTPCLYT